MTFERLECSDHPSHGGIRVREGHFEKHGHRWRDTISLQCNICGAKRTVIAEQRQTLDNP